MPAKGGRHTPAAAAKIAAAVKSRWEKPEYRAAMIAGLTGRPVSDETRKKMSETRTGSVPWNKGKATGPLSEEHRKKIGDRFRGKPKSEGHRKKIGEANKIATRPPVSDETRRKLSEMRRGKPRKPHSEETKRKLSEAAKGRVVSLSDAQRAKLSARFSGENNPRWIGGASFEPYCVKFNGEFKERVREFFGRKCVECGAEENGIKHCIHHVNFEKMACCTDSVEPLFVSLCRSCHSKTNHNREYWEARFTALIRDDYGGRCYLPKRELGTPLLGELCVIREGSERVKLDFEATFDPLAPREETDA